jgi:hypothetical protein
MGSRLNEQHTSDLLAYAADANEKLAGLKARVDEEHAAAAKERRRPFKIVPLTEVEPAVMGPLLASLKDVPDTLKETVGTISRVCEEQTLPFAMRSDQLKAILDLAGIKGD